MSLQCNVSHWLGVYINWSLRDMGCLLWIQSLILVNTGFILVQVIACLMAPHHNQTLSENLSIKCTWKCLQNFCEPGPCITNVFATCRKNFSQWHRSFQRKLRSHWLKFLPHVAITLVIQDPVQCLSGGIPPSTYPQEGGSVPLPNPPVPRCVPAGASWEL